MSVVLRFADAGCRGSLDTWRVMLLHLREYLLSALLHVLCSKTFPSVVCTLQSLRGPGRKNVLLCKTLVLQIFMNEATL